MRESKQQQILFFIKGALPLPDDLQAAEALGTRAFRNVKHAVNPPEKTPVRVAGCVPPSWLKAKTVTVVQVPPAQSQTKK